MLHGGFQLLTIGSHLHAAGPGLMDQGQVLGERDPNIVQDTLDDVVQ